MAQIELRHCEIDMLDGLSGTAKIADAGALTGSYLYKTTNLNATGETAGGTESASVSPAGQRVKVTWATGPVGTIKRRIYRTAAGGATGTEKLVAEIDDNTTTVFIDNVPDGSLGASVPTLDTSDGLTAPAAPTLSVLGTTPTTTDTTCEVNTVALNTKVTTQIPVGARFQLSTVGNNTTVFTTQARSPASGPTTQITFSPAFGAPAPANGDTLNFLPQKLTIKIGDGDIKFTEKKDYQYVLDRGNLDTVRENNQTPMEVSLDFLYQFITTGTGEAVSPVDALKQEGSASEWVTASADPCEPYCVDIRLVHTPPCTNEIETVLFPDFRRDQVQYDPKAATINISGKCNAMEPVVTRSVTAPI